MQPGIETSTSTSPSVRFPYARHHEPRTRVRGALACVAGALVALAAGDVAAHSGSITHATAAVSDDRREVAYRLLIDPPDTAELVGLGKDADPPDEVVAAKAAEVIAQVQAQVSIQSRVGEDAAACPIVAERAGVVREGGRFVEVAWTARCDQPIETLVIEYELFFDIDPRTQGMVVVSYRGASPVKVFRPGYGRLVWDLDAAPPKTWPEFIVLGVEHIVFGYDHVAFLLGLLLVIVIARGHSGSWERRALGSGMRYTAGIVTSFTIAHSLTLVAATLGWIDLPSRPVEIVIAASIAYIAIENILRPDAAHRYLLTFVFGLIHGLGFASMLAELLPPSDVIVPLVMFNVGVELGQLVIVAIVLPLLAYAARSLGALRYRAWVVNVGSCLLALSGVLWLIERVFEITILPLE